MAKKPSMLPIFVVGGVGIAFLIGLNSFQFKNRPKTPNEIQMEMEIEAEKMKLAGTAPKPKVDAEGQGLAQLDSDTWLGPPNGEKTVTIGYHMTPAVQAEPMSVFGPVSMMMKQKGKGIRIHLVNLDDPSVARVAEGMSYNNKLMVPLKPEGGFDATMVQSSVPNMMRDGIP